jgi:hypothetical protein
MDVMTLKRWIGWLVTIVIAVIIVLLALTGFFVDYQWFDSIGYLSVFMTRFITQAQIAIPVFIAVFAVLYAYSSMIKRDYMHYMAAALTKRQSRLLNTVMITALLFISAVVALSESSGIWSQWLTFINSSDFGIKDPIFGRDLSLYMFRLPFLHSLYSFILNFTVILAMLTILVYALMYISDKTRFYRLFEKDNVVRVVSNKDIVRAAIKRIAWLGFIFFLTLAFGYYLKAFDLLYSTRGKVVGAGYTDIHVTLLFYRILMIVSVAGAFVFIIGAIRQKIWWAASAPLAIVALLVVSAVAGGVVQGLIVSANEFKKEQPYIENNIKYTKMAYGLDKIEEKDFNADQTLTVQDLNENRDTIDNIRINDYRPALEVYNQLQGIRLYYQFNDIDIDRYMLDERYTEVFLSPRELNIDKLPDNAKTWINQHLRYTHGYGVVMSPVNAVTPSGQPQLVIKDIPPKNADGIDIKRPEIYFGESTDQYVIVKTGQKEFDYPMGEQNKETIYQEETGIAMSFANRLLFTLYTGDFRLLLSSDINAESRILINRDIADRVRMIAPFLRYDDDPYIVIGDDGRLYWIIDAYTTSNRYPYSEPDSMNLGVNYMRNSVKVIIDAYNGKTDFYIVDKTDPVANVYKGIFPKLFKDADDMPAGLKDNLRYPQLLFDVQAEIYRRYHMTDPQVFYSGEDAWNIANEKYGNEIQEIESQYIIMKLPGEDKAEFILMVPFTPVKKDNMTAWMAARMDGDNYGKLVVYRFPKDKLVYGPMQVEYSIDQDTNISKELTLWNQQGSSVVRGNTLVIPIENSLLYVEPLYIRSATESSLPEVKKVIMFYENKLVMEDNLEAALNRIFGIEEEQQTQPATPATPGTPQQQDLIRQANDLLQQAKDASQRGDWAAYGEYLKQLEDVLEQAIGGR